MVLPKMLRCPSGRRLCSLKAVLLRFACVIGLLVIVRASWPPYWAARLRAFLLPLIRPSATFSPLGKVSSRASLLRGEGREGSRG